MPLNVKSNLHKSSSRYAFEAIYRSQNGNDDITPTTHYLSSPGTPYLVLYVGWAWGNGTTTTPDIVAIDQPSLNYGTTPTSFPSSWKSFEYNYSVTGSGDSKGWKIVGFNVPALTGNDARITLQTGQTNEESYGHAVMFFVDGNPAMDVQDNRYNTNMGVFAPPSKTVTETMPVSRVGIWTNDGGGASAAIWDGVANPPNSTTYNNSAYIFQNLPSRASYYIGFGFAGSELTEITDDEEMDMSAYANLGTSAPHLVSGAINWGIPFEADGSLRPEYITSNARCDRYALMRASEVPSTSQVVLTSYGTTKTEPTIPFAMLTLIII